MISRILTRSLKSKILAIGILAWIPSALAFTYWPDWMSHTRTVQLTKSIATYKGQINAIYFSQITGTGQLSGTITMGKIDSHGRWTQVGNTVEGKYYDVGNKVVQVQINTNDPNIPQTFYFDGRNFLDEKRQPLEIQLNPMALKQVFYLSPNEGAGWRGVPKDKSIFLRLNEAIISPQGNSVNVIFLGPDGYVGFGNMDRFTTWLPEYQFFNSQSGLFWEKTPLGIKLTVGGSKTGNGYREYGIQIDNAGNLIDRRSQVVSVISTTLMKDKASKDFMYVYNSQDLPIKAASVREGKGCVLFLQMTAKNALIGNPLNDFKKTAP